MAMKPNVLVTGVNGLASQSIIRALEMADAYRIVATDIDPMLSGLYIGDANYLVSRSWELYIEEILDVCRKERIDVVIPGSDIELEPLCTHQSEIEATGAKLLVSKKRAIQIGNDKWLTYLFLKENKFPIVDTYLENDFADAAPDDIRYPVIVKPRFGWASTHVYTAKDKHEVQMYVQIIKKDKLLPMIQTYIDAPDDEYTTGIYIAEDGEVLGSLPLWRKLRRGLSLKAMLADDPKIGRKMEEIARKLNTVGPVNIQSRKWQGEYYVFEINTRFSGTTFVQAKSGLNGPDILTRNFLFSEKPRASQSDYQKIVAMLYNNYAFVDYQTYAQLAEERTISRTSIAEDWF